MDPQSTSFTPNQDIWRLQGTVRGLLDTQNQHSDRLARLEQRQEEETRLRSVWGSSSTFPGLLGGNHPADTPAEAANVDFTNFDDDHSANMIRSLHLEPDEEPRRTGAASRANSVRFDESANQGQYGSRGYLDMMSRNPSNLSGLSGGGHPMFERASSHKSDGRHSSAGQSISGRANSFANSLGGLDALSPLGPTPSDAPGMNPGLFILGTVPSIIRCWLDQNFTHKSLLYAAVCSGSYSSFLDSRVIEQLGFTSSVKQDINGTRRIKLPLYLPEAVLSSSATRPSSPSSKIPSVYVDFTVADHDDRMPTSKSIQIFLGSDTLRAHNADILFSSNSMTLFDDEQAKLTVPFVRPEDEDAFKTLRIGNVVSKSNRASPFSRAFGAVDENSNTIRPYINGVKHTAEPSRDASLSMSESAPLEDDSRDEFVSRDSSITRNNERLAEERKPILSQINTSRTETRDIGDTSTPLTSSSRQGSSPAIWSNWRREATSQPTAQGDWAGASKGGSGAIVARPGRDQGIKVLKPTRQLSRSTAPLAMTSPATSTTSSRLAEDRRRSDLVESTGSFKRSVSTDISRMGNKDVPASSSNGKVGANPVGGASAFGWLNSSASQPK